MTHWIKKKAPPEGGAFFYRLKPDPAPFGVSVDPLGEELGASLLPEGLVTEFGPLAAPGVLPDVVPVAPPPIPVVLDPLPIEDPAVPLPDIPAEPPADPPAPPAACANASELDSAHVVANVAANAIALSFIVSSSLLREVNSRQRPMFRGFARKPAGVPEDYSSRKYRT